MNVTSVVIVSSGMRCPEAAPRIDVCDFTLYWGSATSTAIVKKRRKTRRRGWRRLLYRSPKVWRSCTWCGIPASHWAEMSDNDKQPVWIGVWLSAFGQRLRPSRTYVAFSCKSDVSQPHRCDRGDVQQVRYCTTSCPNTSCGHRCRSHVPTTRACSFVLIGRACEMPRLSVAHMVVRKIVAGHSGRPLECSHSTFCYHRG